jgi:hypothetical protein
MPRPAQAPASATASAALTEPLESDLSPGSARHSEPRGKDMKKAIVTGAALLTTLGGATAVGAATALPAAGPAQGLRTAGR